MNVRIVVEVDGEMVAEILRMSRRSMVWRSRSGSSRSSSGRGGPSPWDGIDAREGARCGGGVVSPSVLLRSVDAE